jgi:hypothetical protein
MPTSFNHTKYTVYSKSLSLYPGLGIEVPLSTVNIISNRIDGLSSEPKNLLCVVFMSFLNTYALMWGHFVE